MASTMQKHAATKKDVSTDMPRDSYIQSRQNVQIKNIVKLRERKHRDRQSKFIIEGLRELSHAIEAGYTIESIYFCPENFPQDQHSEFIDRIRMEESIPLTRLSEDAFEKASYREGPDGILALAKQQGNILDDLQTKENPLLLVLEGIEKPGNVGAIFAAPMALVPMR